MDKLDRNIFGIILIVAQREPEVTMTKDPVCGMQVDEKKAAAKSMYEGKSYSFCSTECRLNLIRNPMISRANQIDKNTVKMPGKLNAN